MTLSSTWCPLILLIILAGVPSVPPTTTSSFVCAARRARTQARCTGPTLLPTLPANNNTTISMAKSVPAYARGWIKHITGMRFSDSFSQTVTHSNLALVFDLFPRLETWGFRLPEFSSGQDFRRYCLTGLGILPESRSSLHDVPVQEFGLKAAGIRRFGQDNRSKYSIKDTPSGIDILTRIRKVFSLILGSCLSGLRPSSKLTQHRVNGLR